MLICSTKIKLMGIGDQFQIHQLFSCILSSSIIIQLISFFEEKNVVRGQQLEFLPGVVCEKLQFCGENRCPNFTNFLEI